MKICPSVDRTFLVLLAATFLFAALMVFVEWKFHDDGQIFQVMSGLATGAFGAALLRIKAPSKDDHPVPGETVTTTLKTETQTIEEPKP